MWRARAGFLAGISVAFLAALPVAGQPAETSVTPELRFAIGKLDRGDYTGALTAGKLAFRSAQGDRTRFHAARVTAIAALSLDKPIATRFWLRRAGDVAPGPAETAKIKRYYQILQARSPWRTSLNFGLRHSDNVNNGANSPLNVIDGVPLVGVLSGRAQALPGTIATTQASLTRRLHRTERTRTRLQASVVDQRVRLDDEAKEIAPGVRSREFDQTQLTLALLHSRAWAKPGLVSFGSVGVSQRWYGRERYAQSVQTTLGQRLRLGPRVSVSLTGGARREVYDAGGDREALQLGASVSYAFPDGARLSLSLGAEDKKGTNAIFDHDTRTVQVGYALGKPIMGVTARASLGWSSTDYADFSLGILPVPGGRQDDSVFGTLDLTLDDVSYAGFTPRLIIKAADTDSNVSRFSTDELSVSIGISSSF